MAERVAFLTLVTGYGGPSAVAALLEAGWKLFGSDRVFSDPKTRKAFAKANPKVTIIDELEPEKAIAEVVRRCGRIDLLFSNNFVPLYPAAVETASVEVYRDYLEGLTIEPFRAARAAIVHMKKQKAGKIIFVTSAGPLKGLPNLSTYCAARGGANALTKALAREVGRFNIQVNAIAPNYVENPTYFPKEILDTPFMRKLIKDCPIERYARPEEMGALVAFLATEESNFVTSQVIPFCGGWAS